MHPIKYPFVWLTYVWLRFDPILWLTFRHDWKPRFDFMAALFGKKDTLKFLDHRVELVKERKKKMAPLILPSDVDKKEKQFFKENVSTKTGREERLKIIKKLIHWGTDQEINQQNIDSYKTRARVIESLLNHLFQNSFPEESDLIINSLDKFVFSRVTQMGVRGEPSPEVHNYIIKGVGRLLTAHFAELDRLSHQGLDKMTKIQLIKELQKGKANTGSLAFSGSERKDDDFQPKFPLPEAQVALLASILNHYRHSGWPESREQAPNLINSLQTHLGFDIN